MGERGTSDGCENRQRTSHGLRPGDLEGHGRAGDVSGSETEHCVDGGFCGLYEWCLGEG